MGKEKGIRCVLRFSKADQAFKKVTGDSSNFHLTTLVIMADLNALQKNTYRSKYIPKRLRSFVN